MFASSQQLLQHPDGLAGALAALQQEVRSRPAELRLRVLLFQLLAVLGQWQRALAQLQVVAQLDATHTPLAQAYRVALRAELLRADVFAGKRSPQILGQPTAWMARLIQALQQQQAQPELAGALRREAMDAAPAVAGHIDGQPFDWITDGDSRLGPTLEAVIHGQYYWLPFEQIARLQIDAPADLRDLVWAQARITLRNDGDILALLPVRYPGPEQDDRLRLAQQTEWQESAEDQYIGRGQKMWMTDSGEYALLDTRDLQWASC